MRDAPTTIAVPRGVRIFNAALPVTRVSRDDVAALAAQVERDSWAPMLLRHPHLAARLESAAVRRRA